MSRAPARADSVGSEDTRTRPEVDWALTRSRDRALDDQILACVRENERVLDLGCGNGDLLDMLKLKRHIRERGVEIEGQAALEAISRGLSVVHGDLAEALSCQADDTFDVVLLNQVITNVEDPVGILEESVRVGRRVVVTFPNFAYWRNRLVLLLKGSLPVTPSLPYQWFDTPNIRLLTVRDFKELCSKRKYRIEREQFAAQGRGGRLRTVRAFPNHRASLALFLLTR